jgi:hypothetical protein
VKESQKVPRLELDERIQRMNCVSKPYLNPHVAGIGSEILLGHTFLGDFMPFLLLARSNEPREQFAISKAPS